MAVSRHVGLTNVVTKLAVAQRRGWLTVRVDTAEDSGRARFLFKEFVRCGVLAHFEQAQSRGRRRGVAYLLFLRYRDSLPVSRVWAQTTRDVSGCRLSLAALRQLARTHGGLALLIYTDSGLLTIGECLRRRCGGVLGFGAYVR
jgi:hypothetical protein